MSILTPPNYQQCQEFIEKIKEQRFNKVKERQVRKLNNLIIKKEGGITWQSSQILPATGAYPQADNRQVTPATRASQAANSFQTGRSTPRASHQSSQKDNAFPLGAISQAGNPQALLVDSTLSQAESAASQAGTSPAYSTLSGREYNLPGRQYPVFSGR